MLSKPIDPLVQSISPQITQALIQAGFSYHDIPADRGDPHSGGISNQPPNSFEIGYT